MINIEVKKSKFMPGDFSLYLTFAYNESIIRTIKQYPNRSWHKQTKEWEVPLDKLSDILETFDNQDIVVTGEYVDLTPKKKITEINFDFKTEPFSHQRESFLYGMNNDKWFLGDEMGLGKTKQAIDIAVAMKQQRGYKHCLIICGVNGLKWNWFNEVATHSNETARILGMRRKKKTKELFAGGNADKYVDLLGIQDGDIEDYFLITNVESLRNDKVMSVLEPLVDDGIIPMIVVDEFHKMHNVHNTQQGKALLTLQPEYRLAMTGTPMLNNPLELYGVFRWLGIEKHSHYAFEKYYAVKGGYGGYEIIGYKHLDELEDQLDSIMLRRKKDEVLDLPDKLYVDEYVDMLSAQAVVYREVKAEIKSMIDQIEISPNPLAEMIRLRQATGYTGILSSEVQCSAKLDRMEEIIEDVIADDKKVIIFSNWTQMTDAINERLTQYSPAMITGETADNVRQQNVEAFQNNPDCKVIIGTIGAMGTGVTLTAASVIIFLDHPWNKALYEQAVDRCHRIGQTNKITIYNIMCKNTIDEKVWNLVQKKGAMSDMIVDGVVTDNKRELIDYLLA